MAKCVRIVGQGIPYRMSDADAFRLVEIEKDGQYCPKRFWREYNQAHNSRTKELVHPHALHNQIA